MPCNKAPSLQRLKSGLLVVGGFMVAEVFDRPDRHGRKKFLRRTKGPNGITNAGLNQILDANFDAGTQITAWYFRLVDNTSFSAFNASDTMGSHAGWIENEDYTEATGQQWTPLTTASQSITNTTVATFTMDASATIKGAFISSDSTKGGTTGTLWCTAAFGSLQVLTSGQTLRLSYVLSAASS